MTTTSFEDFPRPLKKQVINGVTTFYVDLSATFNTIDDCVYHLLGYPDPLDQKDFQIVFEYMQNHEFFLNQKHSTKLDMSEVYNNFREYVYSPISSIIRKHSIPQKLKITKQEAFLKFLFAKRFLSKYLCNPPKTWDGVSNKQVIYWLLVNSKPNLTIMRAYYRIMLKLNSKKEPKK